MHLCFVDESGTPAKPERLKPRYFVFGGLVIPEGSWYSVRSQLVGLKRREKYRGELKWRYFAPYNKDIENPMLQWDTKRRNNFRKSVFEIITHNKSLCAIACVCDATLAYTIDSVDQQEDIYFRTYKVVTERFQYFLQDISRETGNRTAGIIVSDHRNSSQDNRMREQHERLVREKNRSTSNYANFIESIFLAPSHMSIGIQLADMVAGALWRYYESGDAMWFKTIKPAFRTHASGIIDGFGIARFPKKGWAGPIIK